MRIVLILLLLANLTLFAYTRLDSGGGEGVLLTDQVQPDKIKLLTPQQVAGLGPAKVAALSDACIEWGPFADPDRTRALADLESLTLGRLLTQKRVEFDGGFMVFMGPFSSRGTADTRAAELKRQGVRDAVVTETGRGQSFVTLGSFRVEAAATAYLESLAAQGIKLAKLERSTQPIAQSMLVVRSPPQNAVARLKELQPQYPGTDVRATTCERSS